MTRLVFLLWKEHLKRWDVWFVVGVGGIMIGTLSLLLLEGHFIREMADFGPLISLIEQTLSVESTSDFDLIKLHIVRSGLLLFQFLGIVLLFLFMLGDPMDNPFTLSTLATYPVSRFNLFTAQTAGVIPPVFFLCFILWIPSVFNALYAGTYIQPFLLGSLFFGIKLFVAYGVFRLLREFVPGSIAGLIALVFYGLAHFDHTFTVMAGELAGLWQITAQIIEIILPPFDQLNRTVVSAYRNTPIKFIIDIIHVILILVVSFGGGAWLFNRREFQPGRF